MLLLMNGSLLSPAAAETEVWSWEKPLVILKGSLASSSARGSRCGNLIRVQKVSWHPKRAITWGRSKTCSVSSGRGAICLCGFYRTWRMCFTSWNPCLPILIISHNASKRPIYPPSQDFNWLLFVSVETYWAHVLTLSLSFTKVWWQDNQSFPSLKQVGNHWCKISHTFQKEEPPKSL